MSTLALHIHFMMQNPGLALALFLTGVTCIGLLRS